MFDMDGVMINSRDNSKRMEGKVAVVWSKRELVKKDTYSLVNKRVMGSFCDPERFYWDIVAELYRRSGGKLDQVESLVRGDGAPFIRGVSIVCKQPPFHFIDTPESSPRNGWITEPGSLTSFAAS